jgi:hypothetical protein
MRGAAGPTAAQNQADFWPIRNRFVVRIRTLAPRRCLA